MNYHLILENWRKFISEDSKLDGEDLGLTASSVKKVPIKKRKKVKLKTGKFKDPHGKYGLWTAGNYGKQARKKNKITCILIHESGTPGMGGLLATLNSKNLSVNWSITKGKVEELIPSEYYTIHAPGYNRESIGIEINHAYWKAKSGEKLMTNQSWHIHNGKKMYGVPSQDTLESTYQLIKTLCTKYSIPFYFPNLDGDMYSLSAQKHKKVGVLAHGALQANRADGLFPCLYMILRDRGKSASEARARSIELLSNVSKAKPINIADIDDGLVDSEDQPEQQ
tara:strand:- start:4 stop:846 length:843 start_codon:yes stop_codon:yes gene_type:complete